MTAPANAPQRAPRQITGWHVLAVFVAAFATIISVNLTLAYNAVHSFPGLEVKNSYVASQAFDADRAAQEALGWDVSARLTGAVLELEILQNQAGIEPEIISATFGRATHVQADQTPDFTYHQGRFTALVEAGEGNWNLRLKARAADGTLFQQRIIVEVQP